MTDSELREYVAEISDELLLTVAFNCLRLAVTRRFDPSMREANRNCCVVALFCIERLLELPEPPDVEWGNVVIGAFAAAGD